MWTYTHSTSSPCESKVLASDYFTDEKRGSITQTMCHETVKQNKEPQSELTVFLRRNTGFIDLFV